MHQRAQTGLKNNNEKRTWHWLPRLTRAHCGSRDLKIPDSCYAAQFKKLAVAVVLKRLPPNVIKIQLPGYCNYLYSVFAVSPVDIYTHFSLRVLLVMCNWFILFDQFSWWWYQLAADRKRFSVGVIKTSFHRRISAIILRDNSRATIKCSLPTLCLWILCPFNLSFFLKIHFFILYKTKN